ncbi:MAG: hypothetical protein KGS72_00720 [Cyanobacteria bacterium REEB67]|nr:hypothetical protein [Cyanobacteria bacterium REEB67]
MIKIISEGNCAERAAKIIDDIRKAVSTEFVLALGATEISDLDNISAAGADAASRRLTPQLDAEALLGDGTASGATLPSSPAGVTSPVVLTRAALSKIVHTLQIVDCGTFAAPALAPVSSSLAPTALEGKQNQVAPRYISLGGRPARLFTQTESLDLTLVEMLFNRGLAMGQEERSQKTLTALAECVPGGTTTALGVLKLLGVEADNLLSSSIQGTRASGKALLVKEALDNLGQRLKINRTDLVANCLRRPLLAVAYAGDPMQAFACGFVIGRLLAAGKEAASADSLNDTPQPIILAGGSQMLAVYALVRAMATADGAQGKKLTALLERHLIVITTKWVAFDPFADTKKLAELIDAPYVAACPDFSSSGHAGLRAYEEGHVKEGVGAGAAMALALLMGTEESALVDSIDRFYEQMTMTTAYPCR